MGKKFKQTVQQRGYMFTRQDPRMENKHKKTCSPPLAAGEMPDEALRK